MTKVTNPPKDKVFSIKCDEYLLNAFKETCVQNDRTASQIMRDFMREYVKQHKQGTLRL
ncbi:hypothetical protein LP090_13050 (plasmid) [Moraxella bovis]|uniref:hypothetical protein n=1 Tax=Moraxella bovis TaxID=476 RepID=UPI002226A38B|nr:hypothetical protein [Moraxella bovis]UYZ69728.1 hypothetical protein LP122_12625 [Moraxella bovis]UYZ72100.1 hypothetical protein LP089_12675 [Moraxella bovis]UYZ90971.1 hypothetical protein LP114_14260 [Moraxella bovis]UZA13484.1 hypothetical protein LP102_08625 [Moraxella bovis]UZA28161.1 hypothetical protein LP119_04135 [Moraxella bovis]